MTEQWFYTHNGKAADPVSLAELKQLAASGTLKPTDLVWKEGMANWVKAGSARGLFPTDADAGRVRAGEPTKVESTNPTRWEEPQPRPRRRSAEEDEETEPVRASRDTDEEGEFDEEDRPRRRRRRKRDSGSPVGLIVGGVVGGIVLLGIVVAVIVGVSRGTETEGTRNFNLGINHKKEFFLTFNQGKKIDIWVTSNGNSDVDLFVYDPTGVKVAWDEGNAKDCHIAFVPPQTQRYKVEIWNRMVDFPQGRNAPNSGVMRFTQGDAVAANVPQVPMPPQANPGVAPPAAVKGNLLTWETTLQGEGDKLSRSFRLVKLTAGQPIQIRVTSQGTNDVDVALFDPRNQMVASDASIGPNSFLQYTPAATGNFRIEVYNLDDEAIRTKVECNLMNP